MDENANKLNFKFTAFSSTIRVTVYAECIYVLCSENEATPKHAANINEPARL